MCRNVLPSRMIGLVVLLGDDSGNTVQSVDRLLDDENEHTKAILSYLTLRVDAARFDSQAAVVDERGWPRPGQGDIILSRSMATRM